MPVWGALAGVTARLTYGTIGASSHPSATEVTAWIEEAEAIARLALNGVGIPTSSLSNDAVIVLKQKVEKYAEGQVRMAWASASGSGENDDGVAMMEEFRAFILEIRNNPNGIGQELGGGDGPTETKMLRSHVTAGVTARDGTLRTLGNGDFGPSIRRGEKF